MPLYDYSCSSCGKIFERQLTIARMDEPLEQECPNCGTSGFINKVIGSPKTIRDTPRLDNGFREVLSKIHERTPGSILKDNIR